MTKPFNYERAFIRNIGWFTHDEQQQLREKRVAIAGLGGAGGIGLMTLARLGIGKFNLSDFDQFAIENFNRQVGARLNTIDRSKLDVMCEMAKEINPELQIKEFPEGVTESNIDEFLSGVDVYLDGLDAFVLDLRAKLFKRCQELNIPAVSAGPLGMGSTCLVFMPNGMSFEEYFCFDQLNDVDKRINFLMGFNPKPLALKYLVDKGTVQIGEKSGPSTVIGCQLANGLATTEVVKILLNRGKIYPVPYYQTFDAYLGKYVRGRLWWGNKNPILRIKKFIIKKFILKIS